MSETPWDGVDDSAENDGRCPHGYDDDEECGWCDHDDEDERFNLAPCGCFFCPCVLRTENGVPCDDCMAGAHQG